MPEAKAPEPASAERSPFTAPTISLPKGGGAIRGIGEKFAANPVTGTGSMSVPIATSPGRSGFGPQLSLSYDSGRGNSEFGFGWSLSLPSITRKTDKGLPQYRDAEESDVFILSGAEDLVPAGDQPPVDGYSIRRYRPRIEGLFARIERWTRDGDVHWRSFSKDNVLTLYGKDGDSRITDPADDTRTFSWLICETRDDKGNAVAYEYKKEDGAGVDLTRAHQRNRGARDDKRRKANRYLKHIRYGNRVPLLDEAGQRPRMLSTDDVRDAGWMFQVVFDYGEHNADAPTPGDAGEWTYRTDPFSSYRAGFEVRTGRLCQRVLMFHHFPGEQDVGNDCLVRSTDFTYSDEQDPLDVRNPVYTFLRAVTHSGYRRANGGYLKRSLPPVEFTYTEPIVQEAVQDVDAETLENLPIGLDGSSYQWTDLHGEGIPGILTEQAGAWFYKRNLSPISDRPVEFAPLERVAAKPNLTLSGGQSHFMDLAGDGQPDVVVLDGPMAGLYEHDDEEGWEPFRPFISRLTRDARDPNLKLVDLDGDGHSDVLISEADAFEWHPSLAEEGFGPARRVAQGLDDENGPRLVFADGTQSVYLADLSGDGLTDLVRIRNGEVCYWPNLGYGRFGAKVTMDNAPLFDAPDLFDQKRIRLADIDGSGTTDIIYLHRGGVRLYFNQSGNSWSLAHPLRAFPRVDDLVAITPVDLLGNGTACLVWSSSLPGDVRRQMRFVDLMGGEKPHLLVKTVNNLGAETRVEYAASTKFYLQDKRDGKPWITRLPFPVHVVERVVTYDWISRNRFFTRYTYHHGYFDGEEREFRGFGRVDQQDTEEFAALIGDGTLPPATNEDRAWHVPPVLTRTWFHTGAYLRDREISRHYAHEYFGAPADPALFQAWAGGDLLEDTVFPDVALTIDEEREAVRALKGVMLRQEVYALDGSNKSAIPYTVAEQNFTIERLQSRDGNRHAVFFTHAREAISYHYERDAADPRVGHTLTLEVDAFGNVLKAATVAYGRRNVDAALPQQRDRDTQAKTLCTYTENDVTIDVDEEDDYRAPLPAESRTYELTGYPPTAAGGRFRASDFVKKDDAHPGQLVHVYERDLNYEEAATAGKERRLIEQLRTLYRKNDLTGLLGPRGLQPLALPGETYKLAFTPGLLAVYGGRVTNAMLTPEGGYVHQGDTNWWIPSGRTFCSPSRDDAPADELTYARQHFFLPHRYRDPFDTDALKTETLVTYDAFDLLPMETRDALLNVTTVATEDDARATKIRNDYRVLQPAWVTEPNGNRTRLAFDALGMVVATAVMGKPAEGQGDEVEGLSADPPVVDLQAFIADPQTEAASLLVRATTRVVYDLARYQRARQPVFAATLARETHFHDPGGDATGIQIALSYSDGFGRELQRKIRAERGDAPQRQVPVALPTGDIRPGDLIRDAQGKLVEGDTALRWVGTGRTVFNNKGKPVLQYEPFFSATHLYEPERDMTDAGVSPILFYDPVERLVATLHPNHTYEKVVFDAWRQVKYDVNDTVAEKVPQTGDPRTDPDIAVYMGAYLDRQVGWRTWFDLRIAKPAGDPERDAAEKAAAHADTPAVAHFDALGRTFVTIAHNKYERNAAVVEEKNATRVELDIEGNQRAVIDANDRVVMRCNYDMLSNRIHQASMEAGERWMLNDVAGKPTRSWDSRGHAFTTEYDQLRRAVREFVRGTDAINSDPRTVGRDVLFQKTEFGEGQPVALNARTRVVKQFDPAGIVTSAPYDFKGNLLHSERQLVRDHTLLPDWSVPPQLEPPPVFETNTTYDALSRPLSVTTPDNSVVRRTYNAANLLERVEANLRGALAVTPFVTSIDYNAKGQRTRIEYATTDGAGIATTYEYDRDTLRLVHLQTRRNAAAFNGTDRPGEVQNLRYTYDPVGNITAIRDDAQQTIYFAGEVVVPRCQYTYDAIYRLIEATGREHIGQVGLPETTWDDRFRVRLPHPNDGQAMRTYAETYEYDPVGNIDNLIHKAANGDWTRTYTYNETSLLEPATRKSNRLSNSSVGHANDTDGRFVHDAHGNMTRMPHLAQPADPNAANLYWDCQDHLRQANKDAGSTGFYVYDAGGQRVRKVWEKAPGLIEERIYLGAVEILRRRDGTGAVTFARETLHIMDAKRRIALVEDRTIDIAGTDVAPAHSIRYQLDNHLGSVSLELDTGAEIISYEEFYPYGTTSYQAVRSQTETAKRYQYTGKERGEEIGLYYHGARYFAPWLGRWTASDPAGLVEGNDTYVYCRSNPVSRSDPSGMDSITFTDDDIRAHPESHVIIGHRPAPLPSGSPHQPAGRPPASPRATGVAPPPALDPRIENLPAFRYVDAFESVEYSLNYRATGGNLSTWLHARYVDGTSLDINIYDIQDEHSDPAATFAYMARGHVGEGGRIFPERMNASTTPRLADAKRSALETMEESNFEYTKATLPAVLFIIAMSVMRINAPPATRSTPRLPPVQSGAGLAAARQAGTAIGQALRGQSGRMASIVQQVTRLGLPQAEATAATDAAVQAMGLRTVVVTVGENQVVSSVMLGSSQPVLVVSPGGGVVQAIADLAVEAGEFVVRNIRF